MDLRAEFHDILVETGHYVLLQRRSKKIRCSCYQEKEQEGESKCPKCLGTGRLSRIERHLIRRETATSTMSLPALMAQTPAGQVAVGTRAFFMEYDTRPQKGDVIMEVGWDKQKPTHLVTAYQVSYVDDMRGEKGRTEFYQVWVKEIVMDTPIKRFVVRHLGRIKNYELIH